MSACSTSSYAIREFRLRVEQLVAKTDDKHFNITITPVPKIKVYSTKIDLLNRGKYVPVECEIFQRICCIHKFDFLDFDFYI